METCPTCQRPAAVSGWIETSVIGGGSLQATSLRPAFRRIDGDEPGGIRHRFPGSPCNALRTRLERQTERLPHVKRTRRVPVLDARNETGMLRADGHVAFEPLAGAGDKPRVDVRKPVGEIHAAETDR